MKIKTITREMPAEFDEAVNEALAQGWDLKNRYLVPGLVTPGQFFRPFFVAELELVPCCDNCKHEACDPDDPSTPCHRCENDEMWEARGS